MELAFDVGREEAHHVMFRFNKFWGGLSISVDGRPMVRTLRMFSVNTTKTYRFSVGVAEVHQVQIDKIRAAVFAGFRRQQVNAYVDGVLVAEGAA